MYGELRIAIHVHMNIRSNYAFIPELVNIYWQYCYISYIKIIIIYVLIDIRLNVVIAMGLRQ